jgi:hypothetical protein
MRSSPGLEDIWQLHWSYNAGIEQNSAGVFIANVDDAATIAGVLTAPPRSGGPGGAGSGSSGAPAAPGNAAPPQTPPSAAAPASGAAPQGSGAGAPGGGRGAAAAAAAHTPAYWIKVSVQPDGTFTVTNSRNGFSKTYAKRR